MKNTNTDTVSLDSSNVTQTQPATQGDWLLRDSDTGELFLTGQSVVLISVAFFASLLPFCLH